MFKIRYKSHHDVINIITKNTKRHVSTPVSFSSIMNKDSTTKTAGIYVHTPFCDKICSFCNLNRKQLTNTLDDYANYLCKEFEKIGSKKYSKSKEIDVVFFGGGTPTIYKEAQLEKILSSLRSNFNFSKDLEFTFESTIHNLTIEKLKIMEKYGVNRISIGIQTFSDTGRKILNRTYDKKTVLKKLKDIKDNFNGLLCTDIIYNYPGETLEEVVEDAKLICDIGVDSSSFYSLMIQDGSKLSKDREEEKIIFKYNLQKDKDLHDAFLSEAQKRGYDVLEHSKISNGNDSYNYIKNINSVSDLIPIGVGAGGKVENLECYNLNKLISFYAKVDDFQMMLKKIAGLLQYKKVLLKDLKDITKEYFPEIEKLLEDYKNKNLIILDEKSFTFTNDGVFWGNSIAADVVEKLISLKK